MKKTLTSGRYNEDDSQIFALCRVSIDAHTTHHFGLTMDPRRANPGTSVGVASRWRSISSKTSTNLDVFCNSFSRLLLKLLTESHRGCEGSTWLGPFISLIASQHLVAACSSRWRTVMHSRE